MSEPKKKNGRPPKINDEAVTAAIRLLSCLTPKSAIKNLLAQEHNLAPRSVERVLARARAEIVKEAGRPASEFKIDGVANLCSIIADPKTTVRERILAQAELNKMLGLCRPERVEVSGPDGAATRVEVVYVDESRKEQAD